MRGPSEGPQNVCAHLWVVQAQVSWGHHQSNAPPPRTCVCIHPRFSSAHPPGSGTRRTGSWPAPPAALSGTARSAAPRTRNASPSATGNRRTGGRVGVNSNELTVNRGCHVGRCCRSPCPPRARGPGLSSRRLKSGEIAPLGSESVRGRARGPPTHTTTVRLARETLVLVGPQARAPEPMTPRLCTCRGSPTRAAETTAGRRGSSPAVRAPAPARRCPRTTTGTAGNQALNLNCSLPTPSC